MLRENLFKSSRFLTVISFYCNIIVIN